MRAPGQTLTAALPDRAFPDTALRGEILTYNPQTGSGLVSGDDLQRYGFTSHVPDLAVGRRIDFIVDGREAREPVLLLHAPATRRVAPKPATSSAITPLDWRNRLFSLNGRMERAYFWTATLGMTLIHLTAWGLASRFPLLPLIILLTGLWPYLAVTTKRLHDIDLTGWLATIPFAVTVGAAAMVLGASVFGGFLVLFSASMEAFRGVAQLAVRAQLLSLSIELAFVVLIGFWAGQPHDNLFGAPPGRRSPLRLEADA